MQNTAKTKSQSEYEFSTLDIILVLAESWKLLAIVPLVVAVVVYITASSLLPIRYVSEAIVSVDVRSLRGALEKDLLTRVIGSAEGLENVPTDPSLLAASLDVTAVSLEASRVVLTNKNPATAQELLSVVIGEFANTVIAPAYEQQIALQEALASELERFLAILNHRAEEADADQMGVVSDSFRQILDDLENRRHRASRQQELLKELPESIIVSSPSAPASDATFSALKATFLAGLSTGLFLLIIVFIREIFRRAAADPVQTEKVHRIYRAFWPWYKPKN